MAGITIKLKDGAGDPLLVAAYSDFNSNLVPGSMPLANGRPITDADRMPVVLPAGFATAAAQATQQATLGAPADVAWDGASGTTTFIGGLKAIWTRLNGLLNTTVTANGALISTVNPMPITLPTGAASLSAQVTTNAALGAPADAAWATGSGTMISILKAIRDAIVAPQEIKPGALALAMSVPAVNTSSVELLPAKATRRYLAIRNIGNADVFLGFGTGSAVLNAGWPVYANGDGLVFDTAAVPNQRISAIAAAATTLVILEV